MSQLTIFDQVESNRRRNEGMQQAIDHANDKEPKWSDIAYGFLLRYMRSNVRFMTEDVRQASEGVVPEPPSQRAWGAVIIRAVKEKKIVRHSYQKVKNVKAHSTPASVWERV